MQSSENRLIETSQVVVVRLRCNTSLMSSRSSDIHYCGNKTEETSEKGMMG